MSCDVAALLSQANANSRTWSIDFGGNIINERDKQFYCKDIVKT